MNTRIFNRQGRAPLTLAALPTPAKALATSIIVALGLGMVGALGQIIIHDIIPTFYASAERSDAPRPEASSDVMHTTSPAMPATGDRGDLFAELSVTEKPVHQPIYLQEQFVWLLKWTHIHLFGMSMIFIFLGAVTIWLDTGVSQRCWLVVLPFIGVLIDILAMWLKAFVSPFFFWLHIPGGGLFVIVFAYVSLRALWEMWIKPNHS